MLEKPDCDWTYIALGEDKYPASYLTDVPMDCLISMINALKYGLPFCVDFDTEGSYFVVMCSSYIYDDTQVIIYEEKETVKTYNITLETLARELYNDINDNINSWELWDYCGDEEEAKTNTIYKTELQSKLKELKQLIEYKYKK